MQNRLACLVEIPTDLITSDLSTYYETMIRMIWLCAVVVIVVAVAAELQMGYTDKLAMETRLREHGVEMMVLSNLRERHSVMLFTYGAPVTRQELAQMLPKLLADCTEASVRIGKSPVRKCSECRRTCRKKQVQPAFFIHEHCA